MLTMDVFNADIFSAISLSAAVDKYGYVPQFLTDLPGLFEPAPVMTKGIFIETRATGPALIQTSPRGTPPSQKGPDQRDARGYNTSRISQASRITAEELQSIRAFGTVTELQNLQREIGRRTIKMKRDFMLTKENYLFNLVQGMFLDADGSTIINWATEFSQSVQTEVAFNFAAAVVGSVRTNANLITRTTLRKLQGLGGNNVKIYALCGDTFYDDLTTSTEVRQTYNNWTAAAQLREEVGKPFEVFPFAGIYWVNYRGTDDNSTLAIAADRAKIFPVGAGIFQYALSPAERFEFVNTPGQEFYEFIVPDRDRQMWADVEMYSYPLPVCVMPQALASARAGS